MYRNKELARQNQKVATTVYRIKQAAFAGKPTDTLIAKLVREREKFEAMGGKPRGLKKE